MLWIKKYIFHTIHVDNTQIFIWILYIIWMSVGQNGTSAKNWGTWMIVLDIIPVYLVVMPIFILVLHILFETTELETMHKIATTKTHNAVMSLCLEGFYLIKSILIAFENQKSICWLLKDWKEKWKNKRLLYFLYFCIEQELLNHGLYYYTIALTLSLALYIRPPLYGS